MSIQEISLSNKRKKRLLKLESLETVLFEDENGDLVVNVNAYKILSGQLGEDPIAETIGDIQLNFAAEYWVFS